VCRFSLWKVWNRKTILLNKFLSQIQSEENPIFIVKITVLSSTSTGVLRSILRSLGEIPSNSSDAILEQIINKVKSIDKTILLVFDDAQNLKNISLLDLRVLCSYVGTKPIKLLLLGQTILKDNLRNEMHTALKETLLYYAPRSFDEIESINYIEHRLVSAGFSKEFFSKECKRLIHLHSDGVPRKINNISLEIIFCAYTDKQVSINEDFFRSHQEEILI
jgi:MSHA biogenesis protein MshM